MRSIDGFEVVEEHGAPGEARLRLEGRLLPQRVPGTVLEAQFRVQPEGSVLLLLTDDVPHEETLHVVLLDADGRMLEHRRLGRPYAPGLLRELRVEGPRTLGFRFWPDHRHRLEIFECPRGLARRWTRLVSVSEHSSGAPP